MSFVQSLTTYPIPGDFVNCMVSTFDASQEGTDIPEPWFSEVPVGSLPQLFKDWEPDVQQLMSASYLSGPLYYCV